MATRRQTARGRAAIKTIILDDQLVFRLGLRMYLAEAMPEIVWAGEADSLAAGIALVQREGPDLVLIDAFLSERPVAEVLGEIRQQQANGRVVVFANYSDSKNLALAASAGADGYMLKTLSPPKMVEALRAVLGGQTWIQPELMQHLYTEFAHTPQAAEVAPRELEATGLTPRQLEVLRLVAQGLRNAEIADQLTISEQTVKTHVAHLLEKLGVTSRLQAARYAISKKLVDA
jgi:DNA-binding NarL/FixJ family response regulator